MLSADLILQIETDLPCRSAEIRSLNALLQVYGDEPPSPEPIGTSSVVRASSLLVYGVPQTGKTSLITSVLQASDEHDFTYIDCKKCITARSLYEYTLDELRSLEPTIDENGVFSLETFSIETLDSFVLSLEKFLSKPSQARRVLLFDHISSALYDNCQAIIQAVHNVFERLDSACTVVFIVSGYQDIPHFNLPTIRFPPYSSDELCQILQETTVYGNEVDGKLIKDEGELKGLWDRFCKTFFSAFYDTVGHDLDLYRSIAVQIFPEYLQPIKDNILSVTNHLQLARSASKILLPEPWILAKDSLSQSVSSVDKVKVDELSICARYLLVAAFLASYNPGKTDRTFFSRGRGEKTKRRTGKRGSKELSKQPQRLLGPKGFTLERMFSIFQAVVPTTYPHTTLLDQQVATLLYLRLILKQGASGDILVDGKWVVNVNLEMMIKISRSINFELNRFLVTD